MQSFNTSTSSTNPNDKIFSENIRKAGDFKKGGSGTSTIVGGTAKYDEINGNCNYSVNYHSGKMKISSMQNCFFKK